MGIFQISFLCVGIVMLIIWATLFIKAMLYKLQYVKINALFKTLLSSKQYFDDKQVPIIEKQKLWDKIEISIKKQKLEHCIINETATTDGFKLPQLDSKLIDKQTKALEGKFKKWFAWSVVCVIFAIVFVAISAGKSILK